MKVFVLGTGGWGIALAMLLHQNGHEVTSWTYLQEECDLLHRERCNEKPVSYTHLRAHET